MFVRELDHATINALCFNIYNGEIFRELFAYFEIRPSCIDLRSQYTDTTLFLGFVLKVDMRKL